MIDSEYNNCFACGKDNPIGLKLKFRKEGELAVADFSLHRNYEGYPNIIHGGIVTTILDEAMAKVILFHDAVAYTAKLEVRFSEKLKPDTPYRVFGRINRRKGRVFETEAWIEDLDGRKLASAKAVFLSPRS